MFTPGAARSTCWEPLEKNAGALPWSSAPTVRTWGRLAGYSSGLPRVAAVARGSYDQRPGADRDGDHRVEHRVSLLGAEAEVDDAASALDDRVEALDDVAGGDAVSGRARIPDLERSLRIDAEQAERVDGCRRDRGNRRAVLLELAGGGLGVQGGRPRPSRELLVRHVDAGVDDGQRLARARARPRDRLPRRESTTRRAEEARRASREAGQQKALRRGRRERGLEARAERRRPEAARRVASMAILTPPARRRAGPAPGFATIRASLPRSSRTWSRVSVPAQAEADPAPSTRRPIARTTPRRLKEANIAPVMATAFVGIGSNLGDREAHLRRAIDLLAAEDGIESRGVSEIRETEPVGPVEQGPFLNGAIRSRDRSVAPRAARVGSSTSSSAWAVSAASASARARSTSTCSSTETRPSTSPASASHIRACTSAASPWSRWPSWIRASTIPGQGPISALLAKLE